MLSGTEENARKAFPTMSQSFRKSQERDTPVYVGLLVLGCPKVNIISKDAKERSRPI